MDAGGGSRKHRSRQNACPICGTASAPDYRPFCSRRCADVDLGRWFSGTYAVPSETPPDEADLDEIVSNDNAPE